jgi:hypothetical protein
MFRQRMKYFVAKVLTEENSNKEGSAGCGAYTPSSPGEGQRIKTAYT